jgi:glycine/D-amino acid oxidase-like deaminating enzyme
MPDEEVDVLVVGAGCSGTVAAVASARNSARTILIDMNGFLGGTSTAVLDTFYAFYTPGDSPEKVVSGIPDEVVGHLEAQDAVVRRPNTYGAGTGITYVPETLKRVWDDLVMESGVQPLFHSLVHDVEIIDGRIRVVYASKAGIRHLTARVVIDASGDADVVARVGGSYELAGRDSPQQTMTTTFRMGGVDTDRAFSFPHSQLHEWMREANRSGRFQLPREEGSAHITPLRGVVATIMTRVPGVDLTDLDAHTAAEIEGRRQAHEYFRFLKTVVPGYENAYLESTSPWIGIRETRRITGDYVLKADDVLQARKFSDAIARCGAPVEDHQEGATTRWAYIPDGETYGVPYRCLLPFGLDHILVSGRCFSSTHEAHASARSMGTCMAMGQAAGTAAALAVRQNSAPRHVPIEDLQDALDRQGADFGQRRGAAVVGQ